MRGWVRRLLCVFFGIGCPPLRDEELERALEPVYRAQAEGMRSMIRAREAMRNADRRDEGGRPRPRTRDHDDR